MAKKEKNSLSSVVSNSLKGGFDLNNFKASKFLSKNAKFKTQNWIPFSQALQDALSIPGIPEGHITIVRGGSDTGKTTLMLETAIGAQKKGILPVFIITEMKWNWEHPVKMGFEIVEIPDPDTGEVVNYEGFFIYVDRTSLDAIEDVAEFVIDILSEQHKGNLPHDLCFFWDSVGSIPCRMSIEQGKNNPMWNAGAMATQFGNFVNQRFPMSRKEGAPFTNTFVVINKTGVQPPEGPMGRPKMTNKGGNAMYWDASLVITFGNITNSGTSKIKAVKNKKNVEFAKRTKIAVDKNHINGITTQTTVVATPHGFIPDTSSAIDKYKKTYSGEWFEDTKGEISIIEDNSEWNEPAQFNPINVDVDETE